MGLYDWQNAAGNAALSRHWVVLADQFRTVNESNGPVYVQRNPFAGPALGVWGIYLSETELPLVRHTSIREPEFPSLISQYGISFTIVIPSRRFSYTSRVIEVEGKTLRVWDSPFDGRLQSGMPFPPPEVSWTSAVIRNGRELPISRMRAKGLHGFFGVATDFDYTEFTEPLGDNGYRCVLPPYVPLYAMHLPRNDGETTLDGVYMAWRPIIARAVEPAGGAAFDYMAMVLPDYHVFEIGTLENGETTARDRIVIDGKVFFVDAGLARERLGDTDGTHFCCAVISSGISVLQFPHTVTDKDATVCAVIEPIGVWSNPESSYSPQYSIAYVMGLMIAPPVGECAAFEWSVPDHGKLAHVAHAAGAATTPPFQNPVMFGDVNLGSPARLGLPVSEEWGTWANSLYPFTPHVNAVQTLEGPKSIHDELPSLRRKTPIYALRQYPGDWSVVEPYPEREVFARAASLQSWARTDCLSPYSSESPTLLRKNENDEMLICGKRIKSVKIKFEPYEPENVGGVQTGTEPNPDPNVLADNPSFIFPWVWDSQFVIGGESSATHGWQTPPDTWWKPTGTTFPPDGVAIFPAAQEAFIRQGRATANKVWTRDIIATQDIPAGPLSPELELLIVSTLVLRMGSINSVGGNGTAQTVAAFCNDDIPLPVAPLSGEYELSRFSVGDVPAAGYLFRFSGSGEWDGTQEFQYNLYLPTVAINDTWELLPPYTWLWHRKPARDAYVSPVAVTETWELSSDHAELYCSLSTVLQEAGTFDPDLSFGYGDARDDIYRDHLVFDQPRGRIANVITYTEGYEPRPALKLVVNARSAMRATLEMDVDVSGVPDSYPWSLSGAQSSKIAAKVAGTAGTGNVSGEGQTKSTHHVLRTFEHQFSADDTALLLAGESVVASTWNQPGGSPNEPHIFDYGGIARRYRVTCTLDVEDVD